MPKKAKTKQGSTSGEQAKKSEVPAIVQEQRDYVTAGEHLNYNVRAYLFDQDQLTSSPTSLPLPQPFLLSYPTI